MNIKQQMRLEKVGGWEREGCKWSWTESRYDSLAFIHLGGHEKMITRGDTKSLNGTK